MFLLKLDVMPLNWAYRVALYSAFLVDNGAQSSMLKSYFSAIKKMLILDDRKFSDENMVLGTLARACKLSNDRVKSRLPIKIKFLENILFELERMFKNQPYLETLYKTILLMGYYGLFRVGELAKGPHIIKAANVNIGVNKKKLLFILYSSKTHNLGDRPQKLKISALSDE